MMTSVLPLPSAFPIAIPRASAELGALRRESIDTRQPVTFPGLRTLQQNGNYGEYSTDPLQLRGDTPAVPTAPASSLLRLRRSIADFAYGLSDCLLGSSLCSPFSQSPFSQSPFSQRLIRPWLPWFASPASMAL